MASNNDLVNFKEVELFLNELISTVVKVEENEYKKSVCNVKPSTSTWHYRRQSQLSDENETDDETIIISSSDSETEFMKYVYLIFSF